jgi:hypothetical protein
MKTSYSSRSRALALLAAASLLGTAACGSTVQTTGADALVGGGQVLTDGSAGPADGLTGDGLSTDGAGPAGGTGGSTSSPTGSFSTGGGTGSSGSTVSSSTAGQAPAPSSGSGPATGDAAVAHGPGVTATTIAIGVPHCTDCSSANAAVGAGGEDTGDTRRYFDAALEDVNSRGGVLGRKLVAVYHSSSASENIDTTAQAQCETWTKDNKVLLMAMRGEIIYQCAKEAGALVIGSGGSGPVFQKYPNVFAPATVRLERLGAVTVKAMVQAGWHKPEPKWPTGRIGLITWDNNEYRYAMDKGWLPALAESGLKATDIRYVAVPQSDKSLADASAAISSAVLSFREKGIDHVFISDGPAGIFVGTGLTFMFLQNAKSQQYYPRYGFNSNNSPGWQNHPADQQSGMLAVDSFDNERINDEGIGLNPQRERCWALMKKKGLKATDGQPTGNIAIGACEVAWFAEALLKRAQSGTTLPQLIAAGESLGTSYRSPYTYGTRLGKGQHDGVALFRNARFDDACACMKYSSKPYEP